MTHIYRNQLPASYTNQARQLLYRAGIADYEGSFILAHDIVGLAMDLGDDYGPAPYAAAERELLSRIGGIDNLKSYLATIRIGKAVL